MIVHIECNARLYEQVRDFITSNKFRHHHRTEDHENGDSITMFSVVIPDMEQLKILITKLDDMQYCDLIVPAKWMVPSVPSLNERDAIPPNHRGHGMLIHTEKDDTCWCLDRDLVTWHPHT